MVNSHAFTYWNKVADSLIHYTDGCGEICHSTAILSLFMQDHQLPNLNKKPQGDVSEIIPVHLVKHHGTAILALTMKD